MADLKISQLSAATALAGTEVVPVVQGGATKKATIDQILAPASGKGIDFSAAGGDVLKMYDEGTWTPVIAGDGTAGTYQTVVAIGTYTRIGNLATLSAAITLSGAVTGGGTGNLIIKGNPFTKPAASPSFTGAAQGALAATVPMTVTFSTRGAASNLYIKNTLGALIQVSEVTANKNLDFTITFQV